MTRSQVRVLDRAQKSQQEFFTRDNKTYGCLVSRTRSPDEQIFEFVFERKKSPSAGTELVKFKSSTAHSESSSEDGRKRGALPYRARSPIEHFLERLREQEIQSGY